MNFEDVIAIIGFTASIAGLIIALLSLKQSKKLVAISILVALGVFSTGLSFYRSHQEAMRIKQIESEIIESLTERSLTFDELHSQLLFRTFPDVKEALFGLVKNGYVKHCLIRSQIEGELVSYRVYYCPKHSNGTQQIKD